MKENRIERKHRFAVQWTKRNINAGYPRNSTKKRRSGRNNRSNNYNFGTNSNNNTNSNNANTKYRSTKEWSNNRNNIGNSMNRRCSVNGNNSKSEIPERKSQPHGREKVNNRRKYSRTCQLDHLERVESVTKIRRGLERRLECRWLQINLEMDGVNLLQIYLVDNGSRHYLATE